jgi:D-sedoheptulose 7-phosphate isomerase
VDGDSVTHARDYFASSLDALQAAAQDRAFQEALQAAAAAMVEALKSGRKIMFAGNGGSAADAQHIAGEFVSRLNFDRAPLAGLALTTDTSVLTAVGNDYGYEDVFARQVAGLGRPGDVFVAITTSGNSPNILKAIQVARESEILVVGMTGAKGGRMAGRCDICLHAPSDVTALIQQVYMVAAHAICGIVEQAIFGAAAPEKAT